jgi:hypothetical protein
MRGAQRSVTKRANLGLASQLGSTARTVLIRCPCGRRNYFDRRAWQWLEVAFCVRCWQAIRYHDLRVITRWEGERMLREQIVFEGELKALRTIETVMRRFLMQFREEPRWTWPPQVRQMAQFVEANLRLAEQARTQQGAQPTVPLDEPVTTTAPESLAPDDEAPGGEAWGARPQLDSDEALLLDAYGLLPQAARVEVLSFIADVRRTYAALPPAGEVVSGGPQS